MKSDLLPSQSHSLPEKTWKTWKKLCTFVAISVLVSFISYHFYKGQVFQNGCGGLFRLSPASPAVVFPTSGGETCPQPSPPGRPSNYSSLYETPEFHARSAMRLSGAIQVPTMSFDDMGPVGEDERWKPFGDFLVYLKKTFPTIYENLDLEIVGGYSPIYTWRGSKPDLKPLMLTAHIDVVPSVTSLDRWTYPPFDGTIDGEWIYGRGASDTKNTLVGILSAVEHLIESNWKPTRTIVIAFGQDEEISGFTGAINIARHLESVYPKNGIAMIVDEGGMGVGDVYGTEFALPGVAEKGYINFEIEVDTQGGHSSVPPPHSSIGILAKITSEIEDSPIFRPHLELSSPIWGYLNCLARHGDNNQIPNWLRDSVLGENPDLQRAAEEFAETSPMNRYLIQTSKAPTIVNGGIKTNALAESAVVNYNTRIDIFSSTREVREAYLDLIRPIAKKYSFRLNDEILSTETPIGNITLGFSGPLEPSPISPVDSGSWHVFSKAIQATFGENVITAPSAMTGNTDTRYYWNLSRNIYRWSPVRVGEKVNIHTVDEKLKIKTHVEGIRFFTELILQVDGVDDDAL